MKNPIPFPKSNLRTQGRSAFTLVELLVVLVVVAVLVAGAFPVFASIIGNARKTACAANLRQLGQAALAYADDHHLMLPASSHQRRSGGRSWSVSLPPYADGELRLQCPCEPNERRAYSYLINDFLTPNPSGAPELDYSRLTAISQPGATMMFAEAAPDYTGSDHFHFSPYRDARVPFDVFARQVDVERHRGTSNFLYVNGRVEALTQEEVRALLADPESLFLNPVCR